MATDSLSSHCNLPSTFTHPTLSLYPYTADIKHKSCSCRNTSHFSGLVLEGMLAFKESWDEGMRSEKCFRLRQQKRTRTCSMDLTYIRSRYVITADGGGAQNLARYQITFLSNCGDHHHCIFLP